MELIGLEILGSINNPNQDLGEDFWSKICWRGVYILLGSPNSYDVFTAYIHLGIAA